MEEGSLLCRKSCHEELTSKNLSKACLDHVVQLKLLNSIRYGLYFEVVYSYLPLS